MDAHVRPASVAPNLTLCLRPAGLPVCLSAVFSLSLEAPGAVMSLYKHREGWGRNCPGEDRAEEEDGGGDGRFSKGGRGSEARGSRRGTAGKIKKPNGTASR